MPLPMDEAIARVSAMSTYVEQIRETAADMQRPAVVTRRSAVGRSSRSADGDTPSAAQISRANTALIIGFVGSMQWSIVVPGYDQLLGYLRAMEKDLVADSPSLRNRLTIDLLNEFETYPQILGAAQVRQFAGVFILDTIKLRFSGAIGDVRVRANTDHWTRYKLARGLPLQVGVYEGLLIAAIEVTGRVEFS